MENSLYPAIYRLLADGIRMRSRNSLCSLTRKVDGDSRKVFRAVAVLPTVIMSGATLHILHQLNVWLIMDMEPHVLQMKLALVHMPLSVASTSDGCKRNQG